jgi:sugar phosphate isomerase/epimerase
MKKSQIAAQLYTLRQFTTTPSGLDDAMSRVKAIGYSAVQISGIGEMDPRIVKEIADRHKLSICATHISEDRLKYDLERVIQEHQLWGCRYVGVGGMPPEYRVNKEGYISFATEFSEIGKKLQEAGLQFIYHNHKFEFQKFNGMTGMETIIQHADASFGFEIDTYWVQAGGANPVEWIYRVKDRMQVVHLKDMAISDDQQVYAEIGEGNMDWTAILKACRDTGVEWYVVEQDTCPGDPYESLEISYRYLAARALE